MSIINQRMSQLSAPLPEFVSRQVIEARRFFLNLNPGRQQLLEVVCGGVERLHADYLVNRQDFPYFAVELVADGAGSLNIDGNEFPLSAGSLFAYGPQTPHTIRNTSDRGMRKYYVDFAGTHARQLLQEAGLLSEDGIYQRLVAGGLHELTELFDMLIREGTNGGPVVPSICESLTRLILQKVRQRRLPAGNSLPPSYGTYERIRRHIDERFLELHSAQDVAGACHVSPVYLSRLFSRFCDEGAYQYLVRRKMNYAAGLLMNEGLLVKEVAYRMSFPDAFQFSRAFKRVYGVSPSQLGITSR